VSCYYLEATAFAKLFVQEQGTDDLISLMEAVEDNRKLISASTPLEVYAAIRRRERSGGISAEDTAAALESLRLEAARMVQEPLNPAVLEVARQLLDRTTLRWPDTLQLAAAIVSRDMFQGMEIIFVSASRQLLEVAKAEGFYTIDAAKAAAVPAAKPANDVESAEVDADQ
jgi:hypothetical protein